MIHLLTIVYGEYHVKQFKETCIRSLKMRRNKQDLESQDTKWHVFTDKKSIEPIKEWISEALPKTILNVIDIEEARRYIDATQSAFMLVAEECMKTDSAMLFAPPDIFFGDGSINGLIKCGEDKDSVVVVPHIRVLPEMLQDELFNCKENVSNAELVHFGWKHLHRSWLDAEEGHPRQNQWGTGVKWKKIEDELYSVVHRLPTPYFIHLTQEDLQYFSTCGGFGHFDHRWPGDILLKRNRQRYVTSSDVAFMVEITEGHKNISNLPGDPNDFWQKNYHNEINKQVLVTLRGEP